MDFFVDMHIKMCPISYCLPRGLSGNNSKYCIRKRNRYSPGGSDSNRDVYRSLSFQNKETNNQTVEQGALVGEEEVKLSSAFIAAKLIVFNQKTWQTHFLCVSYF